MLNLTNQRDLRRRTSGYSLLEVVLASTLTLSTLVPAMSLMRDGIQISKKIDNQLLMANYAVRQLEQQMAIVAASWTSGTMTGDFAIDGYPQLRYIVTRSDAVVDGGLANQLMSLTVTTYIDQNNDDSLTAGEVSCVFATKVGKLATYEAAASG